jgi:hypothetical protein
MKFSDKVYISYSKEKGIKKIPLSDIPNISTCHKNDNFVSIIPILSESEIIYSILDNIKIFNSLKEQLTMKKEKYQYIAYSDNVISVNGIFETFLTFEKELSKNHELRIMSYYQEITFSDLHIIKFCKSILDRSKEFTLFFIDKKEFKRFCDSIDYFTGYDYNNTIDDFLDSIKKTFELSV